MGRCRSMLTIPHFQSPTTSPFSTNTFQPPHCHRPPCPSPASSQVEPHRRMSSSPSCCEFGCTRGHRISQRFVKYDVLGTQISMDDATRLDELHPKEQTDDDDPLPISSRCGKPGRKFSPDMGRRIPLERQYPTISRTQWCVSRIRASIPRKKISDPLGLDQGARSKSLVAIVLCGCGSTNDLTITSAKFWWGSADGKRTRRRVIGVSMGSYGR
jgi:hypothetical protein